MASVACATYNPVQIRAAGRTGKTLNMKRIFLLFLLCILTAQQAPAHAQVSLGESGDEAKRAEEPWTPPDVLDLPKDLLAKLHETQLTQEQIEARMALLTTSLEKRIAGLDPEAQATATASLVALQNNVASYIAVIQQKPGSGLPTIPSQDKFTLEEYLSLRALWRQNQRTMDQLQEEMTQGKLRMKVLRDRTDQLVVEYNQTDRTTPARILKGLDRMAASMEWLTAQKLQSMQESHLRELQGRQEELQAKLEFARDNLQAGHVRSVDFDLPIAAADAALTNLGADRKELAQKLIDSLTEGQDVYFYSQLSLKQQLTLLSAREAQVSVGKALNVMKRYWHQSREGTVESVYEIEKTADSNIVLVKQYRVESEVWQAASKSTLITSPPTEGNPKQKEYFSQAQESAREALETVQHLRDSVDDLEQLHQILGDEVLGSGQGGAVTRLFLLFDSARQRVQGMVGVKLFYIGDTPVTPGSLVWFVMIVLFGVMISWLIRRFLSRIEKRREGTASGSSFYTLGRLLHYLIITVALLAGFTSLGLDLGSLALIAGALSVGIGFGLQSIVNNFLSGLILLFEGSLRAGDYIELDSGVTGVVQEISTRYTRINTNDNVDVIVPNSELVSYKMTNWTLKEPIVRLRIPFGVAYSSDKEVVRQAALEAANDVRYTMKNALFGRKTEVVLTGFGDSSLEFVLLVWVARNAVHRPFAVKGAYYWALETRLHEFGIEIPFPQRDVHLKEPPGKPRQLPPEPETS